jgi:hypothetical protein
MEFILISFVVLLPFSFIPLIFVALASHGMSVSAEEIRLDNEEQLRALAKV